MSRYRVDYTKRCVLAFKPVTSLRLAVCVFVVTLTLSGVILIPCFDLTSATIHRVRTVKNSVHHKASSTTFNADENGDDNNDVRYNYDKLGESDKTKLQSISQSKLDGIPRDISGSKFYNSEAVVRIQSGDRQDSTLSDMQSQSAIEQNVIYRTDMDNTTLTGMLSLNSAWTYSILGSISVGLCGIFPLIVIPIEAGPSLKHGAAASHLKLLLSFAVGGLLGDVFLHLLPEAWAHSASDHESQSSIGMWVIIGILSFLIIEKVFAGEDEFERMEDNCYEEEEKKQRALMNGSSLERNHKHTKSKGAQNKNKKYTNGAANGNSSNMRKSSKETATSVLNNRTPVHTKTDAEHRSEHIKVCGWLNLLANCIDNFTHGLAVAGSFLVSTRVGMLTTFAILIHEIPHEVGDFAILLRSGFDRWTAAKAQLLTASSGLIGALTALMAESAQSAGDRTAWILPFTSGGFIYIALVTVTPDLLRERHPWEAFKQVVCLCSGVLAMLIVTVIVQ